MTIAPFGAVVRRTARPRVPLTVTGAVVDVTRTARAREEEVIGGIVIGAVIPADAAAFAFEFTIAFAAFAAVPPPIVITPIAWGVLPGAVTVAVPRGPAGNTAPLFTTTGGFAATVGFGVSADVIVGFSVPVLALPRNVPGATASGPGFARVLPAATPLPARTAAPPTPAANCPGTSTFAVFVGVAIVAGVVKTGAGAIVPTVIGESATADPGVNG